MNVQATVVFDEANTPVAGPNRQTFESFARMHGYRTTVTIGS